MCQGAAMARNSSNAGEGLELAPAPPLAAEQQQRNGRAGKEDRRDEALGQRGQRQGDPHDIEARGAAGLHAGEKAVEREQKQKAQQRLGDGEARKEKRPDGSENAEGRIEAGASSPRSSGPGPGQQGDPENGQRIGQAALAPATGRTRA